MAAPPTWPLISGEGEDQDPLSGAGFLRSMPFMELYLNCSEQQPSAAPLRGTSRAIPGSHPSERRDRFRRERRTRQSIGQRRPSGQDFESIQVGWIRQVQQLRDRGWFELSLILARPKD